MIDTTKPVALPAYLPKRLQAFRIVQGDKTSYLLRDKLAGKTHDLEPWQFFVLEVLPGCEDMPKLLSVFEDRFGRQISEREVLVFFAWLADHKLIEEDTAQHVLLKPFLKQGYAVEQGLVKPKSFEDLAKFMSPAAAKRAEDEKEKAKAEIKPTAGVTDVDNMDPRVVPSNEFPLFEIKGFIKRATPFLSPVKYLLYVLPFLAASALMIFIKYFNLVSQDLSTLHVNTNLLVHVVFSLLTINVVAVLTQAFVAQHFLGKLGPLSIVLRFAVFPRFWVRVYNAHEISRRGRMWMHGAPLLARVFLFSMGVLTWYNNRDNSALLSLTGLSLAFLCTINLLVEGGNPLVKGNGYFWLAAFMDEPYLRGKSYEAFMSKIRGGSSKEKDQNLLAAYALAHFVYAFFIVAVIVMITARFFHGLQIGGATIVLSGALGGYLCWRTVQRFRKISAAYERAQQFDKWRLRALPTETGEAPQEETSKSRARQYATWTAVLTLVLIAFLPYPYEAGGEFNVYPSDREIITSDVPGLIDRVNFKGGEFVPKGTVIATISTTDLKSEIATFDAKIAEQQAVIRDLKARPKPEEVMVAQRAVEVAREREKFSRDRVPRLERLYKDRTISYEELDAARKEHEVDAQEVAKREADLALVKTGVTPEHIAAEQAKLDALVQQRQTVVGKMDRTPLKMPFDGNILTLHLNEKLNSMLEPGKPFAVVESTSVVNAEIEVPETDIGFVKIGAPVRITPNSFYDREFTGKVTTIDRNVTAKSFGTVVKVVATVENRDGMLRTGMTGYAKVGGTTVPVWRAFSTALWRFVSVQVWSWIP